MNQALSRIVKTISLFIGIFIVIVILIEGLSSLIIFSYSIINPGEGGF